MAIHEPARTLNAYRKITLEPFALMYCLFCYLNINKKLIFENVIIFVCSLTLKLP